MTHLKPHNARLVAYGPAGSLLDVRPGLVAFRERADWRLGVKARGRHGVVIDDEGTEFYGDGRSVYPLRMQLDHPGRAREDQLAQVRNAIAYAMASLHLCTTNSNSHAKAYRKLRMASELLEEACRV
ncbi:MAG: hypothetical protein KC492_13645 [Myxococcales bacterium]|nr:hypothetical protein [Myxococcales bacterium]